MSASHGSLPLGGRAGEGAMTAPRASDAVASPCINVCKMNETSGLCEGCLRTLDEIALWSQLDDEVKREVWALLPGRRAALTGGAR